MYVCIVNAGKREEKPTKNNNKNEITCSVVCIKLAKKRESEGER